MTTPAGHTRRSGRRVRTRADDSVPHALQALASVLADIARGSTRSDDLVPPPAQAVTAGSNGGGTSARPIHRGHPSGRKEPMP
jgi:hypothetical protein